MAFCGGTMNASTARAELDLWPELPLEAWQDTYSTLHLWTQIVGKLRLALSPNINHWWGVPLYVNALGLTTSAIPYAGGNFEVQFDFVHHKLIIRTSNDAHLTIALAPRSVADFYREFKDALASLGIQVKIWNMPVEIPDPIAFDKDTKHAAYDPEYANRFWRILVSCESVFKEFRAGFIGKASPVHFFWGSFDLAATRFSGRRAPERPGADSITREAYSHEVSSVGFWPGSGAMSGPAFYSYASPEPQGFKEARVRPEAAHYDATLGEFLLAYDDVRIAQSPSAVLLDFCQSTYDAAANLGK